MPRGTPTEAETRHASPKISAATPPGMRRAHVGNLEPVEPGTVGVTQTGESHSGEPTATQTIPSGEEAPHYVIEWTSEFIRKWWTGAGWSENPADAQWYDLRPDAPRLTKEEEARAVHYRSGTIEPG